MSICTNGAKEAITIDVAAVICVLTKGMLNEHEIAPLCFSYMWTGISRWLHPSIILNSSTLIILTIWNFLA